MTIFNKFLVFNRPVEEEMCKSCQGSGKYKTSRLTNGTYAACLTIGLGLIISILNLKESGLIHLLIFSIFLILGVITLIEYKEQTNVEKP